MAYLQIYITHHWNKESSEILANTVTLNWSVNNALIRHRYCVDKKECIILINGAKILRDTNFINHSKKLSCSMNDMLANMYSVQMNILT